MSMELLVAEFGEALLEIIANSAVVALFVGVLMYVTAF